jgi:DNA primase
MSSFSPVEEIKNRLDIVDVIGSYIKLQKAGINYRAVCPFHSENKPSFFVSPSRQTWHCFGCSSGGDIFSFVMQIEGIEFADALRLLARRAGVELKPQSLEDKKWQTEKQRLYEICELATKFFEAQLKESKTGRESKKYLVSRGISEESIGKWRIGYAPDVWQGLADFLKSKGYRDEEIKKTGLGLSSQKGSFYDRFRGRIIFPIADLNSQIIGFGGRIFKKKDDKEVAKYVNTPQTLLYDKSRVLYGLDKAKVEIRKKDFCILVEGYVDLIMVSQAGFENVVAVSGTALTSYQLNILKRYSDNLLIAFDMDIAGNAATKRGINLAQSLGFNIKVVVLPSSMDPADLVSKDKKAWAEAVEKARSIMDFYFESALADFDKKTPEGKKNISDIILPVIKRIPNKIVQSHWISELAGQLKVSEESIEEEMKKIVLEQVEEVKEEKKEKTNESAPKTRKDLLEERLAILILKSPESIGIIEDNFWQSFSLPVKEILSGVKEKKNPDSELFSQLSFKAETDMVEEEEIEEEIKCCLNEIVMMENKSRLSLISQEIKSAEREKNWQKVEKLIKEFNKLCKNQKK